MRPYPDQDQHFEDYVTSESRRRIEALASLGIVPSATLTHALGENLAYEARERYDRDVDEIREHNVRVLEERRRHDQQRLRARLRLCICAPAIALFGAAAWRNFAQSDDFWTGLACTAVALIFAVMLAIGVITDWPKKTGIEQENKENMHV